MMKRPTPRIEPTVDENNAIKLRMLNAHSGIDRTTGAVRMLFLGKKPGEEEAYYFDLESILEAQRRC